MFRNKIFKYCPSEHEYDPQIFSFDLSGIRRPDNTFPNLTDPSKEAVFETALTIINLDGNDGGDDAGDKGVDNGGTAVVVLAVTETRQFRGRWRQNRFGGEIDGTLIQNYEVGMANLDQLKHQWEIVDDR